MNLQAQLRSYAEKAERRNEMVAASALLAAAAKLDEAERAEGRRTDLEKYDASREAFARAVADEIRCLRGVVDLLRGLKRDEQYDGWRLSQMYVEAHRLPTPEQALAALQNSGGGS